MKTLDKPTTFADLLAEEATDDEQIDILKKRLLIPLGVFVSLLVAWMVWAPLSGAVVAPAEIKMTSNARLVVEARIRPQDINRVHKDAVTEVRLTSFDAGTTPLLKGKVTFISGDAIPTADGRESYFTATVEVDAAVLSTNPDIRLQPGMPAELYIAMPQTQPGGNEVPSPRGQRAVGALHRRSQQKPRFLLAETKPRLRAASAALIN